MLLSVRGRRSRRAARGPSRVRVALVGVVVLAFVLAMTGAATAQTTTTLASGSETTSTPGSTAATGTPGSTAATGTPGPAQPGLAPGPTEFSALNPGISLDQHGVTILPEYDTTTTEVLVFVDVTIPDSVPLPVTFKFVVPGNARVTGFAQVDPQGQYDYNRPNPQFEAQGDYVVVTVQAPTYRQLHLEYYYNPGPGMPGEGAKSYPVVYTVTADSQTLAVFTQEPKRAEGFTVEPPGEVGAVETDGYRYARNAFSGVKAGDQVTLTLSYTKNDAETSEEPAGGPTEQQSTGASWLLYLVVAVVVVIVAFVVYRLIAGRRASASGGRPGPGGTRGKASAQSGGGKAAGARGQTGAKAKAPGAPPPPNRFCTMCGARLSKKDRFCPECGHERES